MRLTATTRARGQVLATSACSSSASEELSASGSSVGCCIGRGYAERLRGEAPCCSDMAPATHLWLKSSRIRESWGKKVFELAPA
eukprot:2904193-Prymnesium_polylepis.1